MHKSGFIGILMFLALPCGISAQSAFHYFDPADTNAVPKLLSQTKLYVNIGAKQMIPEAVRFDVNSPLWSDASQKMRWILLKKNTSVGYKEADDYWDYPDSAVFIKLFAIDTVPGDTTSRTLWETRLLINKKSPPNGDSTLPFVDKWYAFSYKWRRNQADADLVSIADGENDSIRVYAQGKGQPPYQKKWHFPSQYECSRCHVGSLSSTPGRTVLGFFGAQLNMKNHRGAGNQLDTLFARGILKGIKADWSKSPRWYGLDDSTSPGSTLDARARSYIGANCSGCHGTRGNANHAAAFVTFNYDFHKGVPEDEFRGRSLRRAELVADVEPLNVAPSLVVPGYPQKSMILFRQSVRNTTPGDFFPDSREMPPLGSYEVNPRAVTVLTRWIMEMDTLLVSVRPGARGMVLRNPVIQGRTLVLPSSFILGPGTKVAMTGIQGRRLELVRVSEGSYAIPSSAAPGLYAFTAGSRRFLMALP